MGFMTYLAAAGGKRPVDILFADVHRVASKTKLFDWEQELVAAPYVASLTLLCGIGPVFPVDFFFICCCGWILLFCSSLISLPWQGNAVKEKAQYFIAAFSFASIRKRNEHKKNNS